MKRKIIIGLLTATMLSCALSACGKQATPTSDNSVVMADNTTEPTSEPLSTEEPTAEPTAEPTTTPETVVTTPEPTTAPTAELATTEEPTAESTATPETAVTTPEPTTAPTAEPTTDAPSYTFTELNQTLYAKSAVNLRNAPSTSGERIGSLSTGEEVSVNGKCNETGWYRISYNGTEAYVSNNYLVDTKPVSQTATTTTSSTTTTQEAQLIAGFVDILNAKRAEAGLSQVSTSSSLDATALQGAITISTNYSHGVVSGSHDRENIGKGFGLPDAQAIFNAWFESEGHKQQMMDPYLITASAAYYKGYVIFVGEIDEDAYSRDIFQQTNQQIDNGELNKIAESTDPTTGAGTETYASDGVSVLTPDDPMYDEVMSWDW